MKLQDNMSASSFLPLVERKNSQIFMWGLDDGVLVRRIASPKAHAAAALAWHPLRAVAVCATRRGPLHVWGAEPVWAAFAPQCEMEGRVCGRGGLDQHEALLAHSLSLCATRCVYAFWCVACSLCVRMRRVRFVWIPPPAENVDFCASLTCVRVCLRQLRRLLRTRSTKKERTSSTWLSLEA